MGVALRLRWGESAAALAASRWGETSSGDRGVGKGTTTQSGRRGACVEGRLGSSDGAGAR
jgi:hypothetical protein